MHSDRPTNPPSLEIRNSWARSRAHGLRSDQPAPLVPVVRAELDDRLEANARLLTFSRPVIENLYQQIGSPSSTVLLTDRDGLILSSVGCPDFLDRAAKLALSPGVRWRESDVGTNAIGTALHTGALTTVRGNEHFLDRNHMLTCVAKPILAPRGGVLGILDFSTDARDDLSHAHALLNTTAELIEHRLVESLDDGFLSIHFHNHPDLLDSPLEALAVFDEDRRLIASNRLARRLLSLDAYHPVGTCDECFATRWAGLVGWAALRQSRPFPVRTMRGCTFYARATLNTQRRRTAPPSSHCRSRVEEMAHGDTRIAEIVAMLSALRHTKGLFLVEGETGTGKTHLTRALHEDEHAGQAAAFITLDCAMLTPGPQALSEALAALGAARGGTLVLSQVGGLAAAHQAALFAAHASASHTRIIGTTSRPVSALRAAGHFAYDAFEAHGGHTIRLPALRDRTDFAALVRHFVRELCPDRNIYVCPDAMKLLRRHAWAGNLGELRTRLKLILALMGDSAVEVCPEDIPEELFDNDEKAKH